MVKILNPSQIAFEDKVLQKLMHSGGFYSKIIDLDIEGKKEKVLTKTITISSSYR